MPSDQTLISLPKIIGQNPDAPFSIHGNRTITRAELLCEAQALSENLPDKAFAINLCRNRFHFSIAFLAVLLRGQINLLPPNRSPRMTGSLLSRYEQSYCLVDTPEDAQGTSFLVTGNNLDGSGNPLPALDIDKIISLSFTSGSTGEPKAIAKTWREFQLSAELALQRLGLQDRPLRMLSTVPPQHMYGLETSLFWPLFSALCVDSSQPFYPEDIRRIMDAQAQPCLLVSTPSHLKACCRFDASWPQAALLLSSTAPLSLALAKRVEASFEAPLWEIFGSTETLSFASRRLVEEEKWQPYRGIEILPAGDKFIVKGGHLRDTIQLDDRFELDSRGLFTVQGRSADLVKIAGKRNSLTALNRIINEIDGIEDAVFLQLRQERLAALVVSKLSKAQILQELQQSMDAVFLPRPLHHVQRLPRNELGKIVKSQLQQLLKELELGQ